MKCHKCAGAAETLALTNYNLQMTSWPYPYVCRLKRLKIRYISTYPQTDKCNSSPQEPFKFRVWPLLWQPGLIMAPRASYREQHSGWVHYQVKWAQHPIYPMTLVWTVACAGNLNTKFSQQSEGGWGGGQKDLKQHQKHLKKSDMVWHWDAIADLKASRLFQRKTGVHELVELTVECV